MSSLSEARPLPSAILLGTRHRGAPHLARQAVSFFFGEETSEPIYLHCQIQRRLPHFQVPVSSAHGHAPRLQDLETNELASKDHRKFVMDVTTRGKKPKKGTISGEPSKAQKIKIPGRKPEAESRKPAFLPSTPAKSTPPPSDPPPSPASRSTDQSRAAAGWLRRT